VRVTSVCSCRQQQKQSETGADRGWPRHASSTLDGGRAIVRAVEGHSRLKRQLQLWPAALTSAGSWGPVTVCIVILKCRLC
jgi:hypothetical protein